MLNLMMMMWNQMLNCRMNQFGVLPVDSQLIAASNHCQFFDMIEKLLKRYHLNKDWNFCQSLVILTISTLLDIYVFELLYS